MHASILIYSVIEKNIVHGLQCTLPNPKIILCETMEHIALLHVEPTLPYQVRNPPAGLFRLTWAYTLCQCSQVTIFQSALMMYFVAL